MKKLIIFLFVGCISACKTADSEPTWAAFTKCATNNCVKEALAVKDAFIKNPKLLATAFQATYEKGEDHLIGWLYLMRDSVLTNQNRGELSQRIEMQQSIIKAAKSFENDATLKDISKVIVDGMEEIAMMAETEGDGAGKSVPLSPKDSVAAALVVGVWTSMDDPKAGVELTGGKCWFMYDGKRLEPELSYQYHPVCPKDCNATGSEPCLKMTGQDDVCYSIILADGKSLHISQIGGKGNTNRYSKKK